MRICLLGSGSRGNCVYVESKGAAVLIDQGFSHAEMARRMEIAGLDVSCIRAVFTTHEHDDHIRGVGITARKLDIPVYGTAGTLNSKRGLFTGGEKIITIESGAPIRFGALDMLPYSIPHDAAEPVQYCISSGRKKIGIATDLGFVSTLVQECLTGSDLIVLEANHDVDMLRKGSYPWQLKQRIMSRMGHLSNMNAAQVLYNLSLAKRTKQVILAHLSEENNRAEIAEREIRELFERFDRPLPRLCVACQDCATAVMEL